MPTHTLTEREQEWLEHLRRAEELDVTLRDYAEAYELKVKDLYYGKRQLTKKGVLGSRQTVVGDFVPVQIASRPAPASNEALVRLRHPGGWMIECTGWPPAEWLALLLAGSSRVLP